MQDLRGCARKHRIRVGCRSPHSTDLLLSSTHLRIWALRVLPTTCCSGLLKITQRAHLLDAQSTRAQSRANYAVRGKRFAAGADRQWNVSRFKCFKSLAFLLLINDNYGNTANFVTIFQIYLLVTGKNTEEIIIGLIKGIKCLIGIFYDKNDMISTNLNNDFLRFRSILLDIGRPFPVQDIYWWNLQHTPLLRHILQFQYICDVDLLIPKAQLYFMQHFK